MKWINVKHRLPEEKESVLVYDDGWVRVGFILFGEWRTMEGLNGRNDLNITHWQHLPTAPVEGNNENL